MAGLVLFNRKQRTIYKHCKVVTSTTYLMTFFFKMIGHSGRNTYDTFKG